jgi:hypothetical protein
LVPVSVRHKSESEGSRRRASSSCYAGVATYSVECGGTRYSGIGLSFSGGAPCGSSGSGGGAGGAYSVTGGGGGGGGGVSTYTHRPSAYKTVDFCDPCTKAKVGSSQFHGLLKSNGLCHT